MRVCVLDPDTVDRYAKYPVLGLVFTTLVGTHHLDRHLSPIAGHPRSASLSCGSECGGAELSEDCHEELCASERGGA